MRHQYSLVHDKVIEVKEIVVHNFIVGDSEDPDLYAAAPIWDWQQTDSGKWIMEHAVEQPVWLRSIDNVNYGYKYCIKARLTAKDYTFWALKWGSK